MKTREDLFLFPLYFLSLKHYKMKNENVITMCIVILMSVFIIGMAVINVVLSRRAINCPKSYIDLPEEISLVDTSDDLRGYYRNDTLFIEFKPKL